MILVTGGTGLVGSYLLKQLIQQGNTVKAIYRKNSNMYLLDPLTKSKVKWVEADIEDIPSLQQAMKNVSEVYHSAAMISMTPSDKQKMYAVNVKGTQNIVNTALEVGVKKMLYFSSIAALGRSEQHLHITENTPWENSKFNTQYGISKYYAEQEVWRGIAEGLNAVICNPSTIFGPGDWNKGSSRLISRVYDGLSFYPNGSNGFVDVADVVNASIQLMDSNITNQRFIISAENITYKQVLTNIALALNKTLPTRAASPILSAIAWRLEALSSKFTKNAPLITKDTILSTSKNFTYSNEKIKKALNYTFIPLQQTIENTCKQYLQYLKNKQSN